MSNNEFSSPFGFRNGPSATRAKFRAKQRVAKQGGIEAPRQYAPDCPIEERDAALESLERIQAARPLRPPGR